VDVPIPQSVVHARRTRRLMVASGTVVVLAAVGQGVRRRTVAAHPRAAPRFCWLANRRSWNGQNLPCSFAHNPASDAGLAFGGFGSGYSR